MLQKQKYTIKVKELNDVHFKLGHQKISLFLWSLLVMVLLVPLTPKQIHLNTNPIKKKPRNKYL